MTAMNTCSNGAILFREEFIDPAQEPFGLWWCRDVLDMSAVSANAVYKAERVKPEDEGCDAVVTIMKNREYGARGKIKLEFNEPSRRFYPLGGSPAKQYSWEMKTQNG